MGKETIETFDNNYMFTFKESDINTILKIIEKEDYERSEEFNSSFKNIDYNIDRGSRNELKSTINFSLDYNDVSFKVVDIFKKCLKEIELFRDYKIILTHEWNKFNDMIDVEIKIFEKFYSKHAYILNHDLFQYPEKLSLLEKFCIASPYKTLSYMNITIIDVINMFYEINYYEGDAEYYETI